MKMEMHVKKHVQMEQNIIINSKNVKGKIIPNVNLIKNSMRKPINVKELVKQLKDMIQRLIDVLKELKNVIKLRNTVLLNKSVFQKIKMIFQKKNNVHPNMSLIKKLKNV